VVIETFPYCHHDSLNQPFLRHLLIESDHLTEALILAINITFGEVLASLVLFSYQSQYEDLSCMPHHSYGQKIWRR
jgi:hypothetical protein